MAPRKQKASASPSVSQQKYEPFHLGFAIVHYIGICLYSYAFLVMPMFLFNLDMKKLLKDSSLHQYVPSFVQDYICLGFEACPTVDGKSSILLPKWMYDETSGFNTNCPVCSPAFFIDVALILLFALQHSGMAREAFKSFATNFLYPDRVERTLYVYSSSTVVTFIVFAWVPISFQPFESPDFSFSWTSLRTIIMLSIQGFGVAGLLYAMATFKGLTGYEKVVYNYDVEKASEEGGILVADSLHGLVRHPMQGGVMLALIPSPFFPYTVGRLVFVLGISLYAMFAVIFLEEPDLERKLRGYKNYKKQVTHRFFPGIF